MTLVRRFRRYRVKLLRRKAGSLRDRALGFIERVRTMRDRAARLDLKADRIERMLTPDQRGRNG